MNIIPRDLLGVPILGIGISMSLMPPEVADALAWPLIQATIGDVRQLGLEKLPYGPNVQIQKHDVDADRLHERFRFKTRILRDPGTSTGTSPPCNK